MIIKLLIEGGNMKPGPAVAQQLGPMGVNMGDVISQVNDATKEFKGMKVPVELDIDEKTKKFTVKTSSPPTSELIKKELKIEKGTIDHKNDVVGNASIEDIIKITKIKSSNMLDKDFKSAVKSVLGTARTIGILVENKNPNELIADITNGEFEKEIIEQKTETDPEKRKLLQDHFNTIKTAQETKAANEKAEADEKKAKEEEKAAKDAAAPATATAPAADAPAEVPKK
jgi:large subunit ribosomal protein L11